jgi:hypothetical protein
VGNEEAGPLGSDSGGLLADLLEGARRRNLSSNSLLAYERTWSAESGAHLRCWFAEVVVDDDLGALKAGAPLEGEQARVARPSTDEITNICSTTAPCRSGGTN